MRDFATGLLGIYFFGQTLCTYICVEVDYLRLSQVQRATQNSLQRCLVTIQTY